MPVFTGTSGDDTLSGTAGDDTISGLGGNDRIGGGGGIDIIDGGDDHDHIRGGAGNDSITGADGDDYIRGGEGDDIIDGGAGFDRAAFVLLDPDAVMVGCTVDLNLQGVAQNTGHGMDTLIGIEHVSGTALDDIIIGNGGDNWLWGEGGNDNLSGNGGDDLIEVGQGNATADGGAGVSDSLSFYNNQDFVGGVTVSLLLQGGAQTVYAGSSMTLSGFENLSGSAFNDTLSGDGGSNILAGAEGDDTLNGGDGADVLLGDGRIRPDTHFTGNSGPIITIADIVVVSAGADTLDGGKGADLLIGRGGNDTLTGGRGSDTFFFGLGSGSDVITDFNASQDSIELYGYTSWTLTRVGRDVLITLDGGADSILVLKATRSQVSGAIDDVSGDPLPGGGSTDASDWFL